MNSNNTNTSKGCLGWVQGLGGAIIGLLTAAASCAAILQYMQSAAATPAPSNDSTGVVVVTSVPVATPQPKVPSVSPEQWQLIDGFLKSAVTAQITAFQYGDPSYATMFAGEALQMIQYQITDLNSKGVMLNTRFDYDNSYIHDIRVTGNNQIEVDWCGYWANDYYERQTGNPINSYDWTLLPQIVLIEYFNDNFYITKVANGQGFCS